MDTPSELAAEEIKRLRGRLNDLRSVMAHADLWANGEPPPGVTQLSWTGSLRCSMGSHHQRIQCLRSYRSHVPTCGTYSSQGGALHEGERTWRVIVDSIPGQVALLKVNGEVDFVNRAIVDYTGRTLEELKQWGTTRASSTLRTCHR